MRWTKPDFEEISLGMEVTAYVNTDERRPPRDEPEHARALASESTETPEKPA